MAEENNTEGKPKGSNSIKRFSYGEAALWLGFVWLALIAMDNRYDADTITLAAVFALAAIGVRATRPAREPR